MGSGWSGAKWVNMECKRKVKGKVTRKHAFDSHRGGFSSGLAHQGGLLRWPSIGMISHLGGHSGWAHQEDLSLGGPPFGWSLLIVVFH